MSTTSNEDFFEITDLSGGVQRKSSKFLRKDNQVELAVNNDFSRIGGVEKISGYAQVGNTITTTSTSTSTSTTTSSTTSSSTSSSSTTTMA